MQSLGYLGTSTIKRQPVIAYLPPSVNLSEHGYNVRLRAGRAPGDGNCLFHSLASLLQEEDFVCPHCHTTADSLRQIVAQTVLIDHPRFFTACEFWKEVCDDDEFVFYRPLKDDHLPLQEKSREKLYRIMLSPRKYWGDQYSLDMLATLLQLNLVVYNSYSARIIRPGKHIKPRTTLFLQLDLAMNHYSPLFKV
jgi:hypothetical protein